MAENKASVEQDHRQKADEKLAQANSKVTELEAKLTVLQMQDKRMPIIRGDLYDFSGSDSEPTSGRSSWKRKKGQVFPPAISYGGFFPSEASMSALADEQMLMMPASSSQAVGSQTTLPQVNPPTSRIAPPWGKGDPPISVTGVLPRPLGKTQAGRNTWQHTCFLESPEFKDTLLLARAKKGTEHTPEDHTIILHALKHEKAQACTSQPTLFMIPSGIMKELTSMMQTWLMNKAACPPAVRQEPDNTLNLLDVDFWLWYQKVTPKGIACAFRIRFWEMFNAPRTYDILTENQYKLPNSNDGCMWLRAPTTCPEWNKGTDKDITVLHWLSKNAGLTSECITEVIKPFSRW